jgi:AcrR family transcriptional regulator
MSKHKKRPYSSAQRTEAADDTRARILAAAKFLFGRKGIDKVTIAEIATRARVAGSTVYAVFKSKEGILRALMEQSLFGGQFQSALKILADVSDPVEMIALTPRVARAIYESESSDLGLLRNMSGFSPVLRKIEQEFEQTRYAMQEDRIRRLFAARRAKKGLSIEDARRILWMYTSRDVYRMLVIDGGWTPQHYQDWLADTLLSMLVEPEGARIQGT